jgi:hypothetical protein
MNAKRLAIIIFALITGLTSPAVAADKVGSPSGQEMEQQELLLRPGLFQLSLD